jgi:hypothetical protein
VTKKNKTDFIQSIVVDNKVIRIVLDKVIRNLNKLFLFLIKEEELIELANYLSIA